MKRNLTIFILAVLFSSFILTESVAGATVTFGPAPTTGNSLIDANISDAWTDFETQLQTEISSNWNEQTQLAKGLGNAAAFSSRAGALDGYQGYDLFAVMFGLSVAAQFPTSTLKMTLNDLEQIGADIEQNGDVYAGFGAGTAINIGINAGFLVKNLYLSGKFFSMSYSESSPDMDVDGKVTTFGIGVNYQFMAVRSLFGLIKWRGISIGSGFIYNNNKLDMSVNGLDGFSQDITDPTLGKIGELLIEPELTMGYDAATYVIPFDINTSFRLLILNVSFGAGIDFIFGGTDITIKNNNIIYVKDTSGAVLGEGYALIDASTPETAPTFIKPRLMAGIGLNLVAAINASVTWYVPDGAAIEISAGIVW